MKAWICEEPIMGYCVVVFAETRNKARIIAMGTDECNGMEYIEIKPRRFPEADSEYFLGKTQMIWDDPHDKRFLIRHGWHCERDYAFCAECDDLQYCEWGQDLLKDQLREENEYAEIY